MASEALEPEEYLEKYLEEGAAQEALLVIIFFFIPQRPTIEIITIIVIINFP